MTTLPRLLPCLPLALAGVIAAGCASSDRRAARAAERVEPGVALVFPPPAPADPDAPALALLPTTIAYAEGPADLDLSRDARRDATSSAFAGYGGASRGQLFLTTVDDFGRTSFGRFGGRFGNDYFRRATIVRTAGDVR